MNVMFVERRSGQVAADFFRTTKRREKTDCIANEENKLFRAVFRRRVAVVSNHSAVSAAFRRLKSEIHVRG
jgi:hypothetical protein